MYTRSDYLDTVDGKNLDRPVFAPLTDGFYVSGFSGKKWVTEVTWDDQVAAAREGGYAAGFVQGSSPDLSVNPALAGLVESVRTSDGPEQREWKQVLRSPAGDRHRLSVEAPGRGLTVTGEWVRDAAELPLVEWVADRVLKGRADADVRAHYAAFVEKVAPHGVSQVQLELPYFLFGLAGFADLPLMMWMEQDPEYLRLLDKVERALHHLARLLVAVGVDFIWLGASGTELLSPGVWQDCVIPQSKRLVDVVHAAGGRSHFHCCGHSGLWVERGFFNAIGPTVSETLSPPPVGTVEDLARARRLIDPAICTRGNILLDTLLNGTPGECAAAARNVIAATRGFRHLVGASDAILCGTPTENIKAVVEACRSAG